MKGLIEGNDIYFQTKKTFHFSMKEIKFISLEKFQ